MLLLIFLESTGIALLILTGLLTVLTAIDWADDQIKEEVRNVEEQEEQEK